MPVSKREREGRSRRRDLAAALAGLVLLLFAGRWTAAFLADRWWAAELSPGAVAFLSEWHVLRLTLQVGGILVASAWFIGHLLLVYRAVGSVQIRRHVANLEIREALTPGALLAGVAGGGALLGLLVGTGVGSWWRDVALAWHGVTYGVADPLLGRDIGLYVAQLPLWRDAHKFFLLLVILALGVVFGLYLLVGAIRWIEGRPAINDHARGHIGWLLAGLALALAWGYLLEPYELVAGLAETPTPAGWGVRSFVAPLLAGVALAAAGLSAIWAARPRHALAAAGWIVLGAASVVGHWLLPAMLADEPAASTASLAVERFNRMAYALEPLRQDRASAAPAAPPALPALWTPAVISRIVAGDSSRFFWTDPAIVSVQGRPRPAWLTVRTAAGGRVAVSAVADGRVAADGTPLFYRSRDSLPRASPAVLLELPADAYRPDAPSHRFGEQRGVAADSWLRRVVLAWALQAGALLGETPPDTRVDWHLSPAARLGRLAPFAEWGTPVARLIDGSLVWLADGYLTSGTFPLSHRVRWRGRAVGSMRAAFAGTVDAESGATHVYLRPGADPLAEAWAGISSGVVEAASAIPDPVLHAMPYPVELFRVQAQEFERRPWRAGVLSGRPSPGTSDREPPRPETQWSADTSGPLHVAVYEIAGERRVSALLLGGRRDGRDALHLVRLDSAAALPTRSVLESRWSRFPSYDLINDSVRDEGARLERGPVRYDLGAGGPVAYQPHFASRPPAPAAIVWVSVAAPGDRLGAGRSLQEAWSNLLGATVPALPGTARLERLEDARRWLQRADSALRDGDWAAFGRAWTALRRALTGAADPDSAAR